MRPGLRAFRVALRLLPRRHRERLSPELLSVYEARLAEATGPAARLGAWLSEMGGVVVAAVRLRRRRVGRGAAGERRRGRRGWPAAGVMGDVGFSVRVMVRRPGLAVLAVLTLGLGIGSASAMFGVVDGVLLRPLGYPAGDRVMSIYPTIEEWRTHPSLRENWDRAAFSQPEFVDWYTRQTSFEQAAIVASQTMTLTGRGAARVVNAGRATAGLFEIAGAVPVRGRLFDASDGDPASGATVLVARTFWQTALGGRADVVGQTIVLDDGAHVVVGVVEDGLGVGDLAADVWLPVSMRPVEAERASNHTYVGLGVLAPGVTLERAEAESRQLLTGMSGAHPQVTHGANVEPRLEDRTRAVRAPLLVLLAAALVLLLAACANFAALLLGAGLDRGGELAVRGALGAGRGRIVRLLLTESALLALLGGAAGVAFAVATTRVLVLLAPAGTPRLETVAVDARVLAFATGLAVLAGVVFGLVPAIALGRQDVADRLRSMRTTTARRQGVQGALVVVQVALATLLLVGGGLLGRTLLHLDRVDPGFRPDGLLAITIGPPISRFLADDGSFRGDAYGAYHDEVLAAIAAVPGIVDVAMTSVVPFSGNRANNPIEPEGYEPAPGEQVVGERSFVSGNYLDLIGVRLLEGRLLGPSDDRSDAAPVVVVSRRLAARFWPDGSALGKKLSFWSGAYTIVGVVDDLHDRTLLDDTDLRYYVPRNAARQGGGGFVVRASVDHAALAESLRAALAAFDPDLSVTRIQPMRDMVRASLAEQRYRARLMLCFAVLALFFAAAGVYGVVNRRVALRRREIGVRIALGAPAAAVLRGVLWDGVRLASAGVVAGMAAALAASRVVAAYVHGVSPTDPITYAAIALVLAAATLLAALAPSIRAARVDPMTSLRAD